MAEMASSIDLDACVFVNPLIRQCTAEELSMKKKTGLSRILSAQTCLARRTGKSSACAINCSTPPASFHLCAISGSTLSPKCIK